ncbi:fic family toxin-antitoxin system, toxin component [Streptomyces sp. NPDC002758]
MHLAIDLGWIIEVARQAGADDPAPEDFGVPLSAVERHKAQLFEQDVYHGTFARAAALAHTLGRLRWLERSNMTVAVAVTLAYLEAVGRPVKVGRDEIGALVDELRKDECTAQSVAALLRSWADPA